MSILWCGCEDIDFPNGGAVTPINTASTFRTGYGRCSLLNFSGSILPRSNVFPGGAVTSCWITWRTYPTNNTSQIIGGLCKDASSFAGLYVGSGATVGGKLTLYRNDGVSAATKVVLATEAAATLSSSVLVRFDMQVINYGASATVNVYMNGLLLITFTGDVRATGVTSLSAVAASTGSMYMSEVIVADQDTRPFLGLVTLAPNANGTTQSWSTPAFTNVNPITIVDTNSTFTNTTAQDNQYNVIDPPAGSYTVSAVKVVARALSTAGATATAISLGVRNGATTAVASPHTTTTAFAPYEDTFATDPTTSAAWVPGDLTNLQINLRS